MIAPDRPSAEALAAAVVPEPDPHEEREWLDALDGVIAREGPERARRLLESLARRIGVASDGVRTPYVNTIPVARQPVMPGDREIERRLTDYARWNAMAMVLRGNQGGLNLGGHIATFASAATLYEVAFDHFLHSPETAPGDLLFVQPHASPGVYARAYLEGRLDETDLDRFRREVDGGGLSSYPHPWLMPDFWQFATGSMGLAPLQAIYQARFLKYLHARGLADTTGRKVWVFLGDGEMDEPESLGALGVAAREGLDNLIFVVNCNLQRLDGPVRGNGKIAQELECVFRGFGWNAIKVLWSGDWDPLLAADDGALASLMDACLDGDYQTFKANGGAYVREHFFGRDPKVAQMVRDLSDARLHEMRYGGHDPQKVYAAYAAAASADRPTVVLAKTVKGYGMGAAGEAQNVAHQQKKIKLEILRELRDRLDMPVSDDDLASVPFRKPAPGSREDDYLRSLRERGRGVPVRRVVPVELPPAREDAFAAEFAGTGTRENSTTMTFVRVLTKLLRDPGIGARIVPIVADESRTFGMEGLFRSIGIYSPLGQQYRPQDAGQIAYYRECVDGQMLEEGINEAGALGSWIAAGTSYAVNGLPMIPFYIFYSMFGFQRIGDLAWAAGDSRARGFLIGATSGRTTLNGEGLQHQDGHSQVMASLIPTCVSYDPAFGYEVAAIVKDGLRRMTVENEDVYYYLTVTNENAPQPPMPEGAEEGIVRGMYRLRSFGTDGMPRAQLLGSGAILGEVLAAAEILANDYGVASDVWSVTSFNELRRDALAARRWNLLHPEFPQHVPYVVSAMRDHEGPIVAATDYVKAYADGIAPYVERPFTALGTDGFGRSDTRAALRRFFEVDRAFITIAALDALASPHTRAALERFGIDASAPEPAKR